MLEDGDTTEITVIGNEGMVGIGLIMGGHSIPGYSVMRSAGHALRLPATYLLEELERGSEFMHLLLRFSQVLVTQMAQTTACNRSGLRVLPRRQARNRQPAARPDGGSAQDTVRSTRWTHTG